MRSIIRFILSLFVTIVAPFIILILGVGVIGVGIVQGWEWMITGGMVLAALGVMLIFRHVDWSW